MWSVDPFYVRGKYGVDNALYHDTAELTRAKMPVCTVYFTDEKNEAFPLGIRLVKTICRLCVKPLCAADDP